MHMCENPGLGRGEIRENGVDAVEAGAGHQPDEKLGVTV